MLGIKLHTSLRLLVAVLFFSLTSSLHAQFENGSVVGTIHDASGAVVAGATVTATNNATGVTTKTTSDGQGDYEIPSLHVGVYAISASAAGFSDAVANNITISVGGRPRLPWARSPTSAQLAPS